MTTNGWHPFPSLDPRSPAVIRLRRYLTTVRGVLAEILFALFLVGIGWLVSFVCLGVAGK